MTRLAVIFGLVALVSAGAYAAILTPQRGGGIGQFDGGVSSSGTVSGGGGGTNFILMIDNSSRILQTDNTSKICKAGGC